MKPQSILVLLLVMASVLTVAPVFSGTAGNSWKEYGFVSTSILAYDFDSDGVPEIIALPYYVIDGYVPIRSPYEQYEHGLLADVNLDGHKELVLYNDAGDYLVYSGTKLLKHFYLGPGKPVVDLTHRAIAVGNKVLYNMTVYTFQDAQYTDVYPVVGGSKLFVLYDKGALYLEDTNGTKWVIYRDDIEPVGAVISYNTLYVLGTPVLGGTVFIKYNMETHTVQIHGFTTEITRVVMWIPYEEVFIGQGRDGNTYRISFNSLVLELTGKLLGCDGRYIYTYSNGKIYVYSPATETTVYEISAPRNTAPTVFGGSYPYLGVAYGDKTYVLVLKPRPLAMLIIPFTVTAGDRVYYRLDTYGAVNATLSVNGSRIPLEGYIVFNRTGTYVFTASVSNGVITVTKTFTVTVLPRPLVISVKVLGPAIAYGVTPVEIDATDGVNGSRVTGIYCTVSTPGQTLVAVPWSRINITLTPPSQQSLDVPLKIVCGDNKYYKRTEYTVNIPVEPTAARIRLDYLGNGRIRISFVSATGAPVPGEVNVFLDGRFVSHGSTPYILGGLEPGNHTVTVEFNPSAPLYRPEKYVVRLTYYANTSEIPGEIHAKVQIADRIKIINNTVVKTEKVKVPEPVYIEKPVLDTAKAALMFAAGLAVGLVAGIVAGRLLKRRGKTGPESRIEKEMKEYEVEIEKT